jgi:hypothetical protein
MKRSTEVLTKKTDQIKRLKSIVSELKKERWNHVDAKAERVRLFCEYAKKEHGEKDMEWPLSENTLKDVYCKTKRTPTEWCHGETPVLDVVITFIFIDENGKEEIHERSYETCSQGDHHGCSAFEDLDIVSGLGEIARGNFEDDGEEHDEEERKWDRLFALLYCFLYGYWTWKPALETEKWFEYQE